MGALDWMKQRNKVDEKQAGQARNTFAEWREDYRLARMRNETGVEPQAGQQKPPDEHKSQAHAKPARRSKANGIDIPY